MTDRITFSELYAIPKDKKRDWFDPRLDRDTHLCVDPFLVFKSKDPRFSGCRNKFMSFFEAAFEIASRIDKVPTKEEIKARNISPTYDHLIQNILYFPEVEEICLGFSKRSTGGSGAGKGFSTKVTNALIEMSRQGISLPKHFESIAIFTKGIGVDGISDATANIIKRELVEYTMEICEKHDVETRWLPVKNFEFDIDNQDWDNQCFELPFNPFNNKPIILVPKRFLRQIPSISPREFHEYIQSKSNEANRANLNFNIHNDLKSRGLAAKAHVEKEIDTFRKNRIIEYASNNPNVLNEFIEHVDNNENLYSSYDLQRDEQNLYKLPRKVSRFIYSNPLQRFSCESEDEFFSFLDELIYKIKVFAENNDGYKLLWEKKDKEIPESTEQSFQFRKEKDAQELFRSVIGDYCFSKKVKLKEESSLGTNPVSFAPEANSYKGNALLIAKLFRNTKLDDEDLKELCSTLKQKRIKYCCYTIFVHEKNGFEGIKEILEKVESFDFGNDIVFRVSIINVMFDREVNLPTYNSSIKNKEVCISYARGGVSSQTADEVCKSLRAEGIKVIRDSDELRYKDSLSEFMKRISRGNCVIVLISDKYLKSQYCMTELIGVLDSGDMRSRIVPLILEDAAIYDAIGIVRYVRYWETKSKELKEELKTIDFSNAKGVRGDADLYSDLASNIGQHIDILRDFLVKSLPVQIDSNFEDIVNEVNRVISE